jgi:hypothetical protein
MGIFSRNSNKDKSPETKCKICGMNFNDERKLEIHSKTHKNKKPKQQKSKGMGMMGDFDKPDFSQVM